MEDFPNPDSIENTEDSGASARKKRKENWSIEKWFQFRRRYEEQKGNFGEKYVEEDDDTEKPWPFSKQWWRKFFARKVIPPPASLSESRPVNLEETTLSSSDEILQYLEKTDEATLPELVESEKSEDEDDIPEVRPTNPENAEARIKALNQEQDLITQEAERSLNIPERTIPLEKIGHIVKRIEKRGDKLADALIEANLLNRRDRKQRHEIAQIKRLGKKSEEQQRRLEKQQETIMWEQRSQNAPVEAPPIMPLPIERQAGLQSAEKPEKTMPGPIKTEERPISPETQPAIILPSEAAPPEEVLARIEAAAAQNIAIERLYERRHELKDEAGVGGSKISLKGFSTPNGDDASLSKPARPLTPAGLAAYSAQNTPLKPQDSGLYRQAVKGGFWGAVAVLILLAVLVLIA